MIETWLSHEKSQLLFIYFFISIWTYFEDRGTTISARVSYVFCQSGYDVLQEWHHSVTKTYFRIQIFASVQTYVCSLWYNHQQSDEILGIKNEVFFSDDFSQAPGQQAPPGGSTRYYKHTNPAKEKHKWENGKNIKTTGEMSCGKTLSK